MLKISEVENPFVKLAFKEGRSEIWDMERGELDIENFTFICIALFLKNMT